jgi:hypothetical protein
LSQRYGQIVKTYGQACPVVISSLRKAHAAGARGGELKDVYKRARHT